MSKTIKFISSEHFGAPEIKGDRWGYLVEMLRICLVDGFNERIDLNKFVILDNKRVRLSFDSNPNYTKEQTIKLTNLPYEELNIDYHVEDVIDENNIICTVDYDIDFSNLIEGGVSEILVSLGMNVKTKVSPLGMIEKFRDGNRSVFVCDEPTINCYFYIDDEKPVNYVDRTNIVPLVFITDKMEDIDTVNGRLITPYLTEEPNRYKAKDWKEGSVDKTGIFHFWYFGMYGTGANTTTQTQIPTSWTLIGNSDGFYFLPKVVNAGQSNMGNNINVNSILSFRKFKSLSKLDKFNYILMANSNRFQNYTDFSYYQYNTITHTPTNFNQYYSSTLHDVNKLYTHDIPSMLLLADYKGKKSVLPYFIPYQNNNITSDNNPGMIISNRQAISNIDTLNTYYPNKINEKYNVSRLSIYENGYKRGLLCGLLHIPITGFIPTVKDAVSKFKFDNTTRRIFTFEISGTFSRYNGVVSITGCKYHISLDKRDWL